MYGLVVLPFLSTLGDSFRGCAVLQLELLAFRHQLTVRVWAVVAAVSCLGNYALAARHQGVTDAWAL